MCSSGGAAWSILGVTTFAVLFNATKFFELDVSVNPLCPDGKNWQSYILLPSRLASNPIYQQVYALWLTNIVMVFLPFLTLLVLNAYIAYTIRQSLRKYDYHQKLSGRNELKEKSREATLVLIIIVCIFLICNFWGFVLTLLERIVDTETLMVEHHTFYTFSREAINFLAIINSSINFVIYIVFGRDFRKELVVVYGCGLRGITMRLPTHDKFSIWRSWAKRGKEFRRNISIPGRLSSRSRMSTFGSEPIDQTKFLNCTPPDRRWNVGGSPIRQLINGDAFRNGSSKKSMTVSVLSEEGQNGEAICSLTEGTLC